MLSSVEHRPWPLPRGPWIMAQSWHDLLFAHWPVPASALRPLVPAALNIDTFDGLAWVGVVPFRMSGVRPRGLFAVPWLSRFPELNLRTYVVDQRGAKPGVFFWSLDAGNPVAVQIARTWFKLPYFNADMRIHTGGDRIEYSSRRSHRGAPSAEFRATYRPIADVTYAARGSLAHWLTERYCLYTVDRGGRAYRSEIHHQPWPLQAAEAEFSCNTLPAAHGITLPDHAPLLHVARRLDVVVWPLRRLA